MLLSLFIVYIILGSLVFVPNIILLIAIVRTPALRLKYIVISARIANDALGALGVIIAGIGRIIVLLTDPYSLRSHRYCMLMPWNIIFIWMEPMIAMNLLLVSLDRLLSILCPLKYFKNSSTIQYLEGGALSAFHRRQNQLTITLCISCIFTFVLYIIPTVVEYTLSKVFGKDITGVLMMYMAISLNLNPLASLAILYHRQKDIANAVRTYLPKTCKRSTVGAKNEEDIQAHAIALISMDAIAATRSPAPQP
uniref:G_PROTEIN_RECEP_F1_2 domain-containing protein n=1 Tax=Ascaris lumbricoides TaxID=6252 RepID=A0A0M3I5F2_ASCLU